MKKFDNVILFMRGIGTTLCALHGFDTVRAIYGDHTPELFLVVPEYPISLYQDLLAAYPHVRVVSTGSTQRWRTLRLFARLLLRKNLVITGPTHRGNPTLVRFVAFLLSRSGGVYAGFETTRSAKMLQDYTAPLTSGESVFHTVANLIYTVSHTRVEVPIRFQFHDNTDILARHGLETGRYIFIHPFAESPIRELSERRWINLFREISKVYPEHKICVSGARKDRYEAERLCAGAALQNAPINVAGACSLQEVASLIAHATVYLGVDTGITHLASVLRSPTVLIGNNSNPYWLPTYSDNTTILTADAHCTCDGVKGGACWIVEDGQKRYRCMAEIPDNVILETLEKKIRKTRPVEA